MRFKSRLRQASLIATFLFTGALSAAEGVTILPRTTGTFRTNIKYMVQGGTSEAVSIPIPFYVIRHPQGIVLFDSGLGEEFEDQVRGWWVHRLFALLLPANFQEKDAAVHQLKEMGLAPEDVKYIIVSHLHYDHAGGLRDFPNATVVVSKAEWENANVGHWKARCRGVMSEQLEGIEGRLKVIDYSSRELGPFSETFDFFGDGSFILISTPGHTPGHQSLLVTTGSGRKVFLTGDAVWLRENFQKPAPKSLWVSLLEEDSAKAWETTLKIREFARENEGLLVIPGHDPHVWGELPEEIR